jgi:hypothetical protein
MVIDFLAFYEIQYRNGGTEMVLIFYKWFNFHTEMVTANNQLFNGGNELVTTFSYLKHTASAQTT